MDSSAASASRDESRAVTLPSSVGYLLVIACPSLPVMADLDGSLVLVPRWAVAQLAAVFVDTVALGGHNLDRW